MSDKIGPTGKFPRGKARPDDEGDISLRIGTMSGGPEGPIVALEFGFPTTWIGFPPEKVDLVCEQLQKSKMEAIGQRGN